MSRLKAVFLTAITVITTLFYGFSAQALELPNRPTHIPQWKLGMQTPASPVKEILHHFHNNLLVLITVITIFVLLLILYICIRYNRKRNPVASKTTHNTLIEVIWTTVPVLILIGISIPSFRLLYYMDRSPDQTVAKAAIAAGDKDTVVYDEMTLKAIGRQWFWEYQYPDNGGFIFESRMLKDDQLTKERPYRLLEVDNRLVLPVDTNIRIQLTAGDVIHAFGVAALGLKTDAVPGHLNETWVRIERPGVYYGQCSELCGVEHGFMPITIEAVTKEEFNAWVAEAKVKFADGNLPADHWKQKNIAAK